MSRNGSFVTIFLEGARINANKPICTKLVHFVTITRFLPLLKRPRILSRRSTPLIPKAFSDFFFFFFFLFYSVE